MTVQVVGYYENDVTFEYGPFVVCRITGMNHCRIEVEVKGSSCPCLCDPSVYKMLRVETECPIGCTHYDRIAPWVEWLNNRVRDKQIVLAGTLWVAPKYIEGTRSSRSSRCSCE